MPVFQLTTNGCVWRTTVTPALSETF